MGIANYRKGFNGWVEDHVPGGQYLTMDVGDVAKAVGRYAVKGMKAGVYSLPFVLAGNALADVQPTTASDEVKLLDKFHVREVYFDGSFAACDLLSGNKSVSGEMVLVAEPVGKDYLKPAPEAKGEPAKPIFFKGTHGPKTEPVAPPTSTVTPPKTYRLHVSIPRTQACLNDINKFVGYLSRNCGVIQLVNNTPEKDDKGTPDPNDDFYRINHNGFEIDMVHVVGGIPEGFDDKWYGNVNNGENLAVVGAVYDTGLDWRCGNPKGNGYLTLFLDKPDAVKETHRLDVFLPKESGYRTGQSLAEKINGSGVIVEKKPEKWPQHNHHGIELNDLKVQVKQQWYPKSSRKCR